MNQKTAWSTPTLLSLGAPLADAQLANNACPADDGCSQLYAS